MKESERFDYLVIKIVMLRKEHRWTQADLASKAGMPRETVNKIEHGDRSPTLRTASKIADAFGMTLSEFVEPRHLQQ